MFLWGQTSIFRRIVKMRKKQWLKKMEQKLVDIESIVQSNRIAILSIVKALTPEQKAIVTRGVLITKDELENRNKGE